VEVFVIVTVLSAVWLIGAVYRYLAYTKSSYYKVTHTPYRTSDKGVIGERNIYRKLGYLERSGARFLFNLYLPKGNGRTTEIDVLMIHQKGLFVFESKNLDGWIFGDAKRDVWVQTLPQGTGMPARKEYFYNPLKQNDAHIFALNKFLGRNDNPYSIIVFSDQCEIKQLSVATARHKIIYLSDIKKTVEELLRTEGEVVLSENEVESVYEQLYPLTQVSEEVKRKHMENTDTIALRIPHVPKTNRHQKSFLERHVEKQKSKLIRQIKRTFFPF
jgi:hypothetical protein